MKIESLKNYIQLSEEEFKELSIRIYKITDFICEDYPNHKIWFFTKQLPAIRGENREILFVRSPENFDKILAMACLKRDEEEQKICTLYVSDECRGLGIGTKLVEQSMEWLGTTKPLITLADYKLEMFKPIIEKYEWELTETVVGAYNDRSKELCFNGTLTSKKDLYDRFLKCLQKRNEDLQKTR